MPTTKPELTQSILPCNGDSAEPQFALVLRRGVGGPELARESVSRACLRDLASQIWLDGWLRRGKPDTILDQIQFRCLPTFADAAAGGPQCRGFLLRATGPEGRSEERSYDIRAFVDLASRAAAGLIENGTLTPGDPYTYELVVEKPCPGAPSSDRQQASIQIDGRSPGLAFLRRSRSGLLRAAEAIGSPAEEHCSVFYTAAALERAERFSRRGGTANPPRETGCVLVGPLCSCPESGEFFVVVCEALEATAAEETTMSLAYTGQTWRRLQTVIDAMQSQDAMRSFRILGQAHGHNFLPAEGEAVCDLCALVETCNRTSVLASFDDRIWMQAVFSGQPWSICHIFGLSARRDRVDVLYSLSDNRLSERGFYVIPEFEV